MLCRTEKKKCQGCWKDCKNTLAACMCNQNQPSLRCTLESLWLKLRPGLRNEEFMWQRGVQYNDDGCTVQLCFLKERPREWRSKQVHYTEQTGSTVNVCKGRLSECPTLCWTMKTTRDVNHASLAGMMSRVDMPCIYKWKVHGERDKHALSSFCTCPVPLAREKLQPSLSCAPFAFVLHSDQQ